MAAPVQNFAKNVVNGSQTSAVSAGSNVTNGNLVVVSLTLYRESAIPTLTAAMLTKTAGTSTIGTITLDSVVQSFNVESTEYIACAVFSCLVTGTGSLTLTLDIGAPNTGYHFLAGAEFSGTWDASRVGAPATATSATNNTTSAQSGNVTVTGTGVIIGLLAPYASANPFTMTEDGAFTLSAQETNFASNMGGELIYRVIASTTTDSADWTIGSSNGGYAVIGVPYQEVGGGGGIDVTPGAATITMTGNSPTVTASGNQAVTPSSASLAMTGNQPSVAATAFTWYTLPAPGAYDSNSILAGQTYPTGSWLRVVDDFDHIVYNYAAAVAADAIDNDINDHATAEGGYTGSDSATFEIKTPAGATAQYTVTANIQQGTVSLGPAAASMEFTEATPTVMTGNNQNLTPAAAALVMTGGTPAVNRQPTDISLSNSSVLTTGGTNAVVGTLSTTDPDSGQTFTYTLVAGTGSTDNASFNISGANLRCNDPNALGAGNFSVRIRSTDQDSNFTEKAFTVSVLALSANLLSFTRGLSRPLNRNLPRNITG